MTAIIINHKLYGRHKITQDVLIDLIKSPALQRLKGVEQSGVFPLHKSWRGLSFTRYEHSLGVMLLLRKFDASLEEQIHGLLHDISHTAFSHVADFVFGTEDSHSYQDSKTAKAYELQGVNKILIKHGFDPKYILDDKRWPLAEKDLPNLCADRLDYTLQDPVGRGLTKIKPKDILKNLTIKNNQFVFKNQAGAKAFASLNLKLNQNFWCNPFQVALYKIFADTLRLALDKKIITKKDLYQSDLSVIKKIAAAKNLEINKKMNLVKNLEAKEVNKSRADFHSRSKIRAVDPLFIQGNKLIKLTKADQAYKKQRDAWIKKAKQGFYIKIAS